jgi:UDP-N-acetylmuramate--alanine ligase
MPSTWWPSWSKETHARRDHDEPIAVSVEDGLGSRELSRPRRIHVVGVGGAGMSAIASMLAAMGHEVSGSDLKSSAATERLAAAGVEVRLGHDPANVEGAELVAVSSAIPASNSELAEARRSGTTVMTRARVLVELCALRRCLAVAGTHGKTTTTSMLALILVEAGLRPSFLIGGDVNEIGTNAVWDSGEWMVVEADESDGTFSALDPEVAVVTNVEPDHLDHYGAFEQLVEAFDRFVSGREAVVAGSDDPVARRLGEHHGADLVGESAGSTYSIEKVSLGPEGASFGLRRGEKVLGRLTLPILGANIVNNAAVATVAAMHVGAPFEAARRALARFAGVARRFEPRGESRGVRFVDDYAHLPTEVRAVISAARGLRPERLVVVFQPHRYSRIAALGSDFADAFTGADVVVVTDIFPAGEGPRPGVTGRVVADAVSRAHPDLPVAYLSGRAEVHEQLAASLRAGDLCLTLGAGDLTTLPDELQQDPRW